MQISRKNFNFTEILTILLSHNSGKVYKHSLKPLLYVRGVRMNNLFFENNFLDIKLNIFLEGVYYAM